MVAKLAGHRPLPGARVQASTVDIDPVLLKPESETGSQIIVQGQQFGSMKAREW